MKLSVLFTAFMVLLTITFIVPTAHAQVVGVPVIQTPLTSPGTTAGTNTSFQTTMSQINSYVLQPIAYVLSSTLLKSITASVVSFVNGKSNGTGRPQFATNPMGTLQTTGDVQALAFLAALKASNSPFAPAIASSLTTNYLQSTSVGGFFAANQCTLTQSSPNINAFLAGNWSQGGVGAWFALTTQNQNNPYTMYQTSQSQLAAVVGGAQAVQLAQLGWGQGMSSWCGPTTPNSSAAPCTNKNGSPGTIQTPGSTINASLNRSLGTDQTKLANTGSSGSAINGVLSTVQTALQTMSLLSSIIKGATGLLGIASPSATANGSATARNTSAFAQYLTTPVTPTAIIQSAPTASSASASQMSTNISQYQLAWNTIGTSAQAVSTSVTMLANTCASQANAAQTALATEIMPVFAQMTAASTTIANANALVLQTQNDLNSAASTGSTVAYSTDLQTLQTASPTGIDVLTAQQNAQITGTATANPTGSLTVSGGSLVDQMNLISANAQALAASCSATTTGP